MARKTPTKTKQKNRQQLVAELRLNPIFRAAQALQALGSGDIDSDIDAEKLAALTLKLSQDFKSVTNGSTHKIEQQLYAQIVVLNELFFTLITSYNQQENAQLQSETLDRAFRATDLCRKSSALLVEIKNPKKRATFIRNQMNQLNISAEDPNDPNLLEPTVYAAMDTGSQTEAVGKNPNLATLVKINGSHE